MDLVASTNRDKDCVEFADRLLSSVQLLPLPRQFLPSFYLDTTEKAFLKSRTYVWREMITAEIDSLLSLFSSVFLLFLFTEFTVHSCATFVMSIERTQPQTGHGQNLGLLLELLFREAHPMFLISTTEHLTIRKSLKGQSKLQ